MKHTPLSRAIQALEDLALKPQHDTIARRAMTVLTMTPVPTDAEWRTGVAIAYALNNSKPASREERRRVIEAVLDAEART